MQTSKLPLLDLPVAISPDRMKSDLFSEHDSVRRAAKEWLIMHASLEIMEQIAEVVNRKLSNGGISNKVNTDVHTLLRGYRVRNLSVIVNAHPLKSQKLLI
ncbi:MAG: hypothetical protein ABID61_05410, partial [Candidatus Micrarchaeota archaeon]